MNVKTAAMKLRDLLSEMNQQNDIEVAKKQECDIIHLVWMCYEIINGHVKSDKAHRWIGYIQGVLVMRNLTTLEKMKELNKTSW